jgi:hypothetical protein
LLAAAAMMENWRNLSARGAPGIDHNGSVKIRPDYFFLAFTISRLMKNQDD